MLIILADAAYYDDFESRYELFFKNSKHANKPNMNFDHIVKLIKFFYGMVEFDAENMAKEIALLSEWEILNSSLKAYIHRY